MSATIGGYIPGVSHHARERMVERWGRDLTPAEWAETWGQIASGKAALLTRVDAGEIRAVALGGMVFRMAWKPDTRVIATVLPEGSPAPEFAEPLPVIHFHPMHLRKPQRKKRQAIAAYQTSMKRQEG